MGLYQEISFIVLDESGVKLSFSEEGSIMNHPPNSRNSDRLNRVLVPHSLLVHMTIPNQS